MPSIPLVSKGITDLAGSMQSFGICRYLFSGLRAKIELMPSLGFCIKPGASRILCTLSCRGVLELLLPVTRDGSGHSVNLTVLGQI